MEIDKEVPNFQNMESITGPPEVIATHESAPIPFDVTSATTEQRTVNLEFIDVNGSDQTRKIIEVTEVVLKDGSTNNIPAISSADNIYTYQPLSEPTGLSKVVAESKTQVEEQELTLQSENNSDKGQELPYVQTKHAAILTEQDNTNEGVVNSNFTLKSEPVVNNQSAIDGLDNGTLIDLDHSPDERCQFRCIEDEVSVEILPETTFPVKPISRNNIRKRKSEGPFGTPYKALSSVTWLKLFTARIPSKKEDVAIPKKKHKPQQNKSRTNSIRSAPRTLACSWAKLLAEQGCVYCPISMCQRSFRNQKFLKRHYQWCQAGMDKTQKCPYCTNFVKCKNGDIAKHVKHHHVDKLLEYVRIYSSIERVPKRKMALKQETEAAHVQLAKTLEPAVTSLPVVNNAFQTETVTITYVRNKGEQVKDETNMTSNVSSKNLTPRNDKTESHKYEELARSETAKETCQNINNEELKASEGRKNTWMDVTEHAQDTKNTDDKVNSYSEATEKESSFAQEKHSQKIIQRTKGKEISSGTKPTVSRKEGSERVEQRETDINENVSTLSCKKNPPRKGRFKGMEGTDLAQETFPSQVPDVTRLEKADKLVTITKYTTETTSESDADGSADEEAPENKYLGEIFDALAKSKQENIGKMSKKSEPEPLVVRQQLRSSIEEKDTNSQEMLNFDRPPAKVKFRGTLLNSVQVMNMNVNMTSPLPSIPATVVALNFMNQAAKTDSDNKTSGLWNSPAMLQKSDDLSNIKHSQISKAHAGRSSLKRKCTVTEDTAEGPTHDKKCASEATQGNKKNREEMKLDIASVVTPASSSAQRSRRNTQTNPRYVKTRNQKRKQLKSDDEILSSSASTDR